MRGKRAMTEELYCLAGQNFAASMFFLMGSTKIVWQDVRELRELFGAACDAHVTAALRRPNRKHRVPTAVEVRSVVDINQ